MKALHKTKMDLQNNDRMEEWFLIVGDWFRETSKSWYYGLVTLLVIAIPLYMLLNLMFEQALVNAVVPLRINYTEVTKLPLTITEKKIFDLGNGTYSGYARIKNPNSDWGVPQQRYTFAFKSSGGNVLLTSNSETFILPGSEKILSFPRFSASSVPTQLDITLEYSTFIRPPTLPPLSLEIQRKSLDVQPAQSYVNAVIVNRTPFKISRVDLPVMLYDNQNRVIGSNYTNINDLNSSESRSFQYVWYSRINNVARIEIVPEINIYNRDIFATVPGTNPFDDID
jgi:hypothetical protein